MFFGFLAMLRNQVFISDVPWMRGEMGYHPPAIMTGEQANLRDSKEKELSPENIATLKRKIAAMKNDDRPPGKQRGKSL